MCHPRGPWNLTWYTRFSQCEPCVPIEPWFSSSPPSRVSQPKWRRASRCKTQTHQRQKLRWNKMNAISSYNSVWMSVIPFDSLTHVEGVIDLCQFNRGPFSVPTSTADAFFIMKRCNLCNCVGYFIVLLFYLLTQLKQIYDRSFTMQRHIATAYLFTYHNIKQS